MVPASWGCWSHPVKRGVGTREGLSRWALRSPSPPTPAQSTQPGTGQVLSTHERDEKQECGSYTVKCWIS